MDFDQMMDAWKAQDEKPLYGVNGDLLQLVLRGEQAKARRSLRWEQWVAWIMGGAMGLFAAFWLWVAIVRDEPMLNIAAAAVGTLAFSTWVGAFVVSRRRQARRERTFGNSLSAEIRRSLSLVEYQLSTSGRWQAAMLWAAPVILGALLLYWLMADINDSTDFWYDLGMTVFIVGATGWMTFAGSQAAAKKLEPRRERLRHLLDSLGAEG